MGILYVWGLFLLPMERSLSVARSTLSIVPALALVSFTVGMVAHTYLLRSMSLRAYAILVFALTGAGHLLFWYGQNLGALMSGYGLCFGFGAGLGYGLALALAGQVRAEVRSLSIGIVMAAFALSGVFLSSMFAGTIATSAPESSFGVIGFSIFAIGLLVVLSLRFIQIRPVSPGRTKGQFSEIFELGFIRLAATFFVLCYIGLMVVSHSTGILEARNVPSWMVEIAPAAFTGGYIVGCLFGGKIVESLSTQLALLVTVLITAAGLVALLAGGKELSLPGVVAIGVVFGSTASLMPVLIGAQYGAGRVGEIYGRLMVSYGAAGLIAPWFTGYLYERFNSYTVALSVGISACVFVILMTFLNARK